jgi:transcriptional regulator with XRE-family HTH domain
MAKTSTRHSQNEITIGARVRAWRVASGITQTQLESAAGLGHNAISRIEKGDVSPRLETLEKVAHALELTLDALHLADPPKENVEVSSGKPLKESIDERLSNLPPALESKARSLMHEWLNLFEETK